MNTPTHTHTSPNWLRLAILAACGLALGWVAFQLSQGGRGRTGEPAAQHNLPASGEEGIAAAENCCPSDAAASDGQEPTTPPKADNIAVRVNPTPPPGPALEGMVWIPGGVYWRGSESRSHRDARPWHLVEVDAFWMDATPVTNEQFAKFVTATGYVTVAERKPKAEDFPSAPPENLVAGSVVFSPPSEAVPLDNHYRWWKYVAGANWRHPEGKSSDLAGRSKHPVVHVAFEDALAYCKWAGKRLPTEAEFEFAARGGLDRNLFAWGGELRPGGQWMANIWQGRFPIENTRDDGYRGTSPVGTFPANKFGLRDMAGNVWQWCSDWYRHDYYRTMATQEQPVRNPAGPPDSHDPDEPGVAKRVMRGGSYLCTDQYCTAYEAGARGKGAPDTGTNHLGFRCVK